MSDNNVSIFLFAKLDEQTSEANINAQIKKIESKLDGINLKIKIDDNVLNSLNNFSKSMEKFKIATEDANKVLKEEQNIIKQTDGTIEKITRQYLKNGEIIEKVRRTTDQSKKQSIESNVKEQQSLEKINVQLGEQIKVRRKLNAEMAETLKETTYKLKPGFTTTVVQSAGELTGYKITEDIQQLKKAEDQIKSFQTKYLNMLKTLRQGKLSNFVDSDAVEYLQNYIKNIKKLDTQTKNYVSTLYQTIKINAQLETTRREEFAKEQERLAKLMAQEEKRKARLGEQIGIYEDLKTAQITEIDIANKLSEQYGNAEIRAAQLNKTTGSYIVTLKENEKQNRVIRGTIDSTTGALYKQSEAIREASSSTKGLIEQLKIALVRVPVWMIAMTAFWGSLRSLQFGLQSITEIDTALTNLKKVTDETADSYANFAIQANEVADSLGKTTTEVIDATTEFARLGYTMQQSLTLAREALVYANVGDMDVDDATQNIISAVKGFRVAIDEEGKNVERILDIYNEVGNNFAISSAGIGEAMRRSAASLYEAGNTIEQAVAMLTAANSVRKLPLVLVIIQVYSVNLQM